MKPLLLFYRFLSAHTIIFAFTLFCFPGLYAQTTSSAFTYTGADQTFTVPAGITSITVKAWGAGGGGANSQYYTVQSGGGGGGFTRATLTVTPGQSLIVRVGQGGITCSAAGTYGGGGAGFNNSPSGGGSGGGYSGVFTGTSPLVIAGGGGGGSAGGDVGSPVAGGGGGTTGGASTYTSAGKGGTQSAGGAAGSFSNTSTGVAPTAGGYLQGGNGGQLSTSSAGESGGGGGGGYYGGGGGNYQLSTGGSTANGPGGGGSSYYINTTTSASTTAGSNGGMSNNGGTAANNTDADYVTGIGNGAGTGGPGTAAGNGRVVISYNTTLPLTLTDFKVVQQGNSASLTWTTTNEQDTKHFIIERSAAGQNPWQQLSIQSAIGTGGHTYKVVDASPLTQTNFYRLRIVDKDGSSELSPLRILNINGKNTIISVYPNPANRRITIIGMSNNDIATLYTLGGLSVRSLHAARSGNEIMTVEDLPGGEYFLKVSNNKGVATTKKVTISR